MSFGLQELPAFPQSQESLFGMVLVQDRAPGPLIAVVSEEGQNHVNQWIADHPTWYIDFGKAMSPVSI